MTIRAVLFDIDGTLVHSNDFHVTAWRQAFQQVGAEGISDADIHAQIGKGKDMLVPALLPGADAETQKRAGTLHGEIFKSRFLHQVRPFAHARDLLARVHSDGKAVVLASSASSEELDHYLDLLDAHALVQVTTSSDDVSHTKPAPDIFATALEKLGPLSPGEVIALGDTPYDAEAAAKCGIAAIGVRSGGFADDCLTRAGAIALYDDVAALLADYENSPITS